MLYEEYNKVTVQGHRARRGQNEIQTQASWLVFLFHISKLYQHGPQRKYQSDPIEPHFGGWSNEWGITHKGCLQVMP